MKVITLKMRLGYFFIFLFLEQQPRESTFLLYRSMFVVAQQFGVVVVETRKSYASLLLSILQLQMLRGVSLEGRLTMVLTLVCNF